MPADLTRDIGGAIFVLVGHDNRGTFSGEGPRDRRADAAASAGHDAGLVVQSGLVFLSMLAAVTALSHQAGAFTQPSHPVENDPRMADRQMYRALYSLEADMGTDLIKMKPGEGDEGGEVCLVFSQRRRCA